jgi:AcrR family transcriptional regulator
MRRTILDDREPVSSGAEIQDTQGAFVPNRLVIPGDSDDGRAKRTRDALAWALIDLMRLKSYDDISVQDICAHAGIGRSTFYAHFADKDEMFVRHIVLFGDMMGSRLRWDAVEKCYQFDMKFLLEHVHEMRATYDSLARSRKIELITKVWQNKFAERFERSIADSRNSVALPMPAALLARHLAGTVINLLTWWLDHHQPMSAAELDEQFHRMIKGLR